MGCLLLAACSDDGVETSGTEPGGADNEDVGNNPPSALTGYADPDGVMILSGGTYTLENAFLTFINPEGEVENKVYAGANSSCTPEMLYQFAVMGTTFVKNVYGRKEAKVGVLNIGEEAGKGNELVQQTYKMLEENQNGLNFVGNIEGKEMFQGSCDVIICDGFVGNVALKIIEGSSSMLFKMIQQEFNTDIISKIIGLLAKPFMKRIYKRINYEEFGGALLLGVKGITVIAHGRSTAYAIRNAVRVAKEAVESGVNKKIMEIYQ